jgi:hypothetical protein
VNNCADALVHRAATLSLRPPPRSAVVDFPLLPMEDLTLAQAQCIVDEHAPGPVMARVERWDDSADWPRRVRHGLSPVPR